MERQNPTKTRSEEKGNLTLEFIVHIFHLPSQVKYGSESEKAKQSIVKESVNWAVVVQKQKQKQKHDDNKNKIGIETQRQGE